MKEFPLKVFQTVYVIVKDKTGTYITPELIRSITDCTKFAPMSMYNIDVRLTGCSDKKFNFFYYNGEWKQDCPELDKIYFNEESAEKVVKLLDLYESKRIYKEIENLRSQIKEKERWINNL